MVDSKINKLSSIRNKSHDSVISVLSSIQINSQSMYSGEHIDPKKTVLKNLDFNDLLGNLKDLKFAASSVSDPEIDIEGFNPGVNGIEF